MSLIEWFLDLTPHQLDVIRTLGGFCAAVSSVLAGIATVYARLAFKNSRDTKNQTALHSWSDGKLHQVSVAELASRIHGDTASLGQEFRSEISDLVNDPRTGPQPRLHGRRRDPNLNTDQITRSPRTRPAQSLYTGLNDTEQEDT